MLLAQDPWSKHRVAQPGMGTAMAPSLPSGALTSAPLQPALALAHLQVGGQGAHEHRQVSPVPGSTPQRESQGSRKKVEKEGLRRPLTPFPPSLTKGVTLPKVMAFPSQGREGPLQRTGPLKASDSLQVSE